MVIISHFRLNCTLILFEKCTLKKAVSYLAQNGNSSFALWWSTHSWQLLWYLQSFFGQGQLGADIRITNRDCSVKIFGENYRKYDCKLIAWKKHSSSDLFIKKACFVLDYHNVLSIGTLYVFHLFIAKPISLSKLFER